MKHKWIADEFNPFKDKDGMKFEFEKYYNPKMEPEKILGEAFNNIQTLVLLFVKPAPRGALIGGIAGGTANYLAGESPQKGMEIGALYGGFIDFSQYTVRYYIELFKSLKAAKRKFAKTNSDLIDSKPIPRP